MINHQRSLSDIELFPGKANNVADLQKEHDEFETVERYKQMKKEFKDKREMLHILLKGDMQRTKNVLQDHPDYQRVYFCKQSYEVLEELDYQVFQKRTKLNVYVGERRKLMKQYEERLVNKLARLIFYASDKHLILDRSGGEAGNDPILRHQRV